MLAEEREAREDQIECKELGIRKDGEDERVVREERESETTYRPRPHVQGYLKSSEKFALTFEGGMQNDF